MIQKTFHWNIFILIIAVLLFGATFGFVMFYFNFIFLVDVAGATYLLYDEMNLAVVKKKMRRRKAWG